MDMPAKVSCETPSSCMIIDMLDGSGGNIDEEPLMRRRGMNASALSSGVSGVSDASSGEDMASA